MIFSSDLHAVLKQVGTTESVWDCAKRIKIFDDPKYEKLVSRLNGPIKIKLPSVREAIENSYRAESKWPVSASMCKECWLRLMRSCFREYGSLCSICGFKEGLSAHHIVPRDERGSNDVWNLIPLCERCHDLIECHDSKPRTREDVIRIGRSALHA